VRVVRAGDHSSGDSGRSPWMYFKNAIGPIFGAGLALWTNKLIETRYSQSLEREKIKERLEERIAEKHEAYSECMRAIIRWNRTHGEQAGEVF